MRNRTKRTYWTYLTAAVMALLLGGCMQAHQLNSLCEEIADECPGTRFEREISISLGPISLGLARFATGFSEDTREAREYLDGVNRIQLAIYKISSPQLDKRLRLPQQLRDLIEEDGWEMVVKSSEKDETAWILYREDDGRIRDMHITALDSEELVMIRISGRLDELFEKAMKEEGSMANLVHSKFGKAL